MYAFLTSFFFIMLFLIFPVKASGLNDIKDEISHSCNIQQGFFYNSSSQVKFGYVYYMSIGGTELSSDFSVIGPDFESQHVFGVISNIYWGSGITDPIEMSVQISVQNRQAILLYLLSQPEDLSVDFKFFVYDYDLAENRYFRCFYNETSTLQGHILLSADELQLHVDEDPSHEVPVPVNYNMQITIEPEEITQYIGIGLSQSNHFVRQWGTPSVSIPTENENIVLEKIILKPAYPNPFNPQTNISFILSENTQVNLAIYNALGELVDEIINTNLSPGIYNTFWNGHQVPSGMYFIILETGFDIKTQKILLIK